MITLKIFLVRVWIVLRLFLLTPREMVYHFKLLRSGWFDPVFYRGANPNLHPVFRLVPRRHFIVYGEGQGLQPNPDFWPTAYLRYNPDVAQSGARPFWHFITQGHAETRIHKELPEVEGNPLDDFPAVRIDPDLRRHPYAMVVHLYYPDLWPEFRDTLKGLDIDFDLYVTITNRGSKSAAARTAVLEDFPEAWVGMLPNRGRDILPFVAVLNTGILNGYRAVCKFHSKKSPHRQDGDVWRQHLINTILPGAGTQELVSRFLADEKAAFLVADGQHFEDEKWWGSNKAKVTHLLRRVDISARDHKLSFPAGSIYWLSPLMIRMIKGLRLKVGDFELEDTQVDGTTAHAFERVIGYLAQAAGRTTRQVGQLTEPASKIPAPASPPTYTSAFYLPQFHPIPENDAWWGKGFTEWRGVVEAQPRFEGHDHPHMPADLGFYDLRVPDVMGQQAAMAKTAGIDAFCVYHYWFDGKRLLEAPLDGLLRAQDIDFPFYLCWANEAWRRNWDGQSGEVLMDQTYGPGFETALVESTLPYMRDPRYQRPDGTRPRFVIYRPEDMPDPNGAIRRLRAAWIEAGIGEVELGAVCFHVAGGAPVDADLFDFWVEMPPHELVKAPAFLFGGPQGNQMDFDPFPDFKGLIYDYAQVAERSLSPGYRTGLPANTIAGIMPSWDNTARRHNAAHIAYGAHPASFDHWLGGLCDGPLKNSYRQELFINAWNEWAEKAVLEPSQTWGRGYLDVLERRLGPYARS